MDDSEIIEGKRARKTRFSGDFQHFADNDSSGDEKGGNLKKGAKATNRTTLAKRHKQCPGCGAVLSLAVKECSFCDYQFSSKSMLNSTQSAAQESQSIREKFPFEPERDDDGSLVIQMILGRRPRKTGSRKWLKSSGSKGKESSAMESKYEYEYLLKYKNLSYLHVQWLSAVDIEAMSHKSASVLNRYLTKMDKGEINGAEEPEIDPSFLEVEKILDYREEEVAEVADDHTISGVSSSASTAAAIAQTMKQNEGLQTTPTVQSNATSEEVASTSVAPQNTTATFATEGRTITQIFQPVERCRRVLERIMEDPYAISFIEPVDTKLYDDYLDIVEEPICLKDVLRKLNNGEYSKYNFFNKFAQDVRKIWKNCKSYNLYKSQIWYSAHALSMQFERLFQAWVLSFADGTVGISDPLGRPWESFCRHCLLDEKDDQLLLCDHCDAAHHIYCLRPPLSVVPEESWVCRRCINWFSKTGAKVLSASAEEEARLLVDGAFTRKVIKIRKKKYLVKWRGLSYRDCTWETVQDINDDQKIVEYHKLNDSPPEEPPLTQAEIGLELAKDRKTQLYPAGYMKNKENPITDLDAQIYAQIRSYHFLKWNKVSTDALLRESGPASHAFTYGMRMLCPLPHFVNEKIQQLIKSGLSLSKDNKADQPDTLSSAIARDSNEGVSESKMDVVPLESVDEKVMELDNSISWYDPSGVVFTSASNVNAMMKSPTGSTVISLPENIEASNRHIRNDVSNVLSQTVYSAARDYQKVPLEPYPSRPPLPTRYQIPSEIEICAKKGSKSLAMRIGNYHDHVVVLGFRPIDGKGTKGPVESSGKIKNGDVLIAINGFYLHTTKFNHAVKLLSLSRPYMYLRFLRIPPSMESRNPQAASNYMKVKNEKQMKIVEKVHSKVPLPLRSIYHGVYPIMYENPSNDSIQKIKWTAEYYKNYKRVIVGTYTTEEEAAKAYDHAVNAEMKYLTSAMSEVSMDINSSATDPPSVPTVKPTANTTLPDMNWNKNFISLETYELTETAKALKKVVLEERLVSLNRFKKFEANPNFSDSSSVNAAHIWTILQDLKVNQSSTLDAAESKTADHVMKSPDKVKKPHDTENKSNVQGEEKSEEPTAEEKKEEEEEADEEDDKIQKEIDDFHSCDSLDSDSDRSVYKEAPKEEEKEKRENPRVSQKPAATPQFSMNEMYRLANRRRRRKDDDDEEEEDDDDDEDEDEDNASEEENDDEWESDNEDGDWKPKEDDDDPESDGPMGRLLRAVNETNYPPIRSDWTNYVLELGVIPNKNASNANQGYVKKIQQIDITTNDVLRIWDNVNSVSKTMNIPVQDVQNALLGKVDDAGGFKWKMIQVLGNIEEEEDEEKAAAEAKKLEEAWKQKIPTKTREYKSGGTLRDYQLEGLGWLVRCWYTKRSSILADEMGLGKTVQVVTFLEHLFEVENIRGPFLICVPLSTIAHWKREFEAWSNMIPCLYHDISGGKDMRDVIREYEWYYKGRSRRLLKFHALITTYDDLSRDYEELAEIPWRVVVVDEAHRLRNVNSKLLECMRSVVAKGQTAYGYQHRILMTGTPLQNNTLELWSLLNFIEPAKFPDIEKFQERFGKISTQDQVENLQRRIAPHLLRRVKEDVAKDIPPKEETIIDVELTTMQKQYYRAIFEHNHGFLMQNIKGNLPKLMNIQMELRKCCNHPFLINGVEFTEMDQIEKNMDEKDAKERHQKFDRNEFERRRMEDCLIPSSGKMVLLDKLLPKLRKENHKVLIFSQMVKMIDIIEEFCEFRKYPCERLDGRVAGNDRQKSIDKFNRDSNSFVFLLSTRAGGVGINLTAADTVVIFDSDWNPQNDIQAMARCHRIGQSKNVTIYRLITRRSFESEMFDRASKKLGLEQALLGTRAFNDIEMEETNKNNAKVDAKEMEQLLREGAYAVLLEDDAAIIKEFYEQDIDKILEQRAHVLVTEGSGQTEGWLNKRKKFGKTSKSMFTGKSAVEHAEIDVNDPDFWRKVLPDLVTPDTMLDRLKDVDTMEDDDGNREVIDKYMKDFSQMMEGLLDLNRRNQLPERERTICLKLLLKITLKEDIFDEDERDRAGIWLSMIEGTRNRRNRQDLYVAEAANKMKVTIQDVMHEIGVGGRGKKIMGKGRGRGKKNAGWGQDLVAKYLQGDDEDEDEDEEEDDDDEEDSHGKKRSHSKRMKNLSDEDEDDFPKKKKKNKGDFEVGDDFDEIEFGDEDDMEEEGGRRLRSMDDQFRMKRKQGRPRIYDSDGLPIVKKKGRPRLRPLDDDELEGEEFTKTPRKYVKKKGPKKGQQDGNDSGVKASKKSREMKDEEKEESGRKSLRKGMSSDKKESIKNVVKIDDDEEEENGDEMDERVGSSSREGKEKEKRDEDDDEEDDDELNSLASDQIDDDKDGDDEDDTAAFI